MKCVCAEKVTDKSALLGGPSYKNLITLHLPRMFQGWYARQLVSWVRAGTCTSFPCMRPLTWSPEATSEPSVICDGEAAPDQCFPRWSCWCLCIYASMRESVLFHRNHSIMFPGYIITTVPSFIRCSLKSYRIELRAYQARSCYSIVPLTCD